MAAAFRLYSELDTFYGQSGQLLPGGYLTFCEAGTTTPKDVFGEEALSTNNGSTVALDSSGRPSVDVWGSGSYFVELFDADDVKQGEADDVQIPGGAAQDIAIPSPGEFVSGDGSNFINVDLSGKLLPDPTGHSGKVLGTDGATWYPVSQPTMPEVPDPEIVVDDTAKSFQAGVSDDPTKLLIQTGSGSATATGTQSSSASITFPVAYGTAWQVLITPSVSSCTPNGGLPQFSVTGLTTTGCTVNFYTGDENNGGSSNHITSAIDFKWTALGTREVTP